MHYQKECKAIFFSTSPFLSHTQVSQISGLDTKSLELEHQKKHDLLHTDQTQTAIDGLKCQLPHPSSALSPGERRPPFQTKLKKFYEAPLLPSLL